MSKTIAKHKIAKHHRKALKDALTSPDAMSQADVDALLSSMFSGVDADDSEGDDDDGDQLVPAGE